MEGSELQTQSRKGKMAVIYSAKGGVGKTSLAVNLAIALHKKKLQVALMDGDFQFGDVNVAMDIGSSFSITDAADSIDKLDTYRLNHLLSKHSSGVHVLSAPESPELADLITTAIISKVCETILKEYDYLIVDSGVGLNDQTLSFMEIADEILLMTTLELISIKNTKRLLKVFETLEMRNKVKVVLNRSTMESVIEASQVPEILGVDHLYSIPNNFSVASKSLNLGIPFVTGKPSSDIAKAVFKIAANLDSNEQLLEERKKQPLLDKLFSLKRKKGGNSVGIIRKDERKI
ncbi:AAA family ATPase [Neobacillus kokaensis]|uniref:Histidine kinase n=1 Tax=Neobacillus kokaensis TaxID=2759023 RepID=A0ABQ3MXX3_9BACI|nr:P-loop NTPase [Neobacillus kokaensis]GHH96694.1 hypothetical protein AM1BK_02370 [Neobacillus kokaensis]